MRRRRRGCVRAFAHAARSLDLGFGDRAGLGDVLGARRSHLVDAAHQAGMLGEQVVEVVDRQREDARRLDGDHRGRAHRLLESASSPKKSPLRKRILRFCRLASTSPEMTKYIASARAPAAEMTVPPAQARARSIVIISPMICASMPRNSGTRESMPKVTTKSRRWIELTKAGRDDADGKGEEAQAHDHGEAGDEPSRRRDRRHVAVAHRRQRRDRPIHRARHRLERDAGGRIAPLHHMHRRRRKHHAQSSSSTVP